jgi:hypothetical protein
MDDATSAAARITDSPERFELAFTRITNNVAGPAMAKSNKTMVQVVFDGLKVIGRSGELKTLTAKYGLPEQLLVPVEIRS